MLGQRAALAFGEPKPPPAFDHDPPRHDREHAEQAEHDKSHGTGLAQQIEDARNGGYVGTFMLIKFIGLHGIGGAADFFASVRLDDHEVVRHEVGVFKNDLEGLVSFHDDAWRVIAHLFAHGANDERGGF